jgi:predicted dehydrogenase
MKKHILIVGNGSIGKRHARNLHKLGCDIFVVDPREDRLNELDQEFDVRKYKTLDLALAKHKYDGAVIATPPAQHQEDGIKLMERKTPIYMEKGITLDLKEAQALEAFQLETQTPFLMGYSWRWWSSLQQLEKNMGKWVGRVRRVEFTMAAHLADWHPWERYQDFYIASRGGVENENHWIDIMLMWFGYPNFMMGELKHISDLDTTTNDCLDLFCQYPGFDVVHHYDLYRRPHERSIKIYGEKGSVYWTPNKIEVACAESKSEYVNKNDRNDMFYSAMEEFIQVIDGKEPSCTIRDGVAVIELLNEFKDNIAFDHELLNAKQ